MASFYAPALFPAIGDLRDWRATIAVVVQSASTAVSKCVAVLWFILLSAEVRCPP